MDVAEATHRLVRRFGPQVSAWCAEAPARAAQLANGWGLVLGEPVAAQGASSVTLHCEWPGGLPAILKLSPDHAFLAEQVAMLRRFRPTGRTPAVLAADLDAGALVMEAIVPGAMAEELAVPPSPRQWAALLADLHQVDPPVDPPRELRDRTEEAFTRIGRRLAEPTIAAWLDQTTWDRALQRCRRLLDTQARQVLLHGDLHLGNVLDGGTRGLVAIDPKVCVGDPCFDAVDFVLAAAGREGVAARCASVAAASDLDSDRLYAWAQVIAPMAAIGELSGEPIEPVLAELLSLTR